MKPIIYSTERGQALILIAFAAIALFAITGLAIDGSKKLSDRRHAQNAADAAVLAGSLANLRGDPNWELKALDRAGVSAVFSPECCQTPAPQVQQNPAARQGSKSGRGCWLRGHRSGFSANT